MKNTFKILFYIKRNALLRNGRAPIMARITINGERVQLATNQSVTPERWDQARNCVRGRSNEACETNHRLAAMRARLQNCYDRMIAAAEPPTSFKIKDMYLGGDAGRTMFLEFFRSFINDFRTLVDVSRSVSSYYKYRCVCNLASEFIVGHYGVDDLPFYRLDRRFVSDFHGFLTGKDCFKHNTVRVYMVALKHIVMQARSRGLLNRDIFLNYRLHSEFVHRNYLSLEEVMHVASAKLENDSLRRVRDLFIFSCFTGLSYIDIRNLRFDHICTIDNEVWICTSRRKTGTEVRVRLFDIALRIIARNALTDRGGCVFRVPSNGCCNTSLRRVMVQTGIERRITFHSGRHTFATSVMLNQGVRIETVSKLLGHKNIRTTQIYASVTNTSVRSEMNRLQKVITGPRCAALA